jgi:hypothetical protein
MKKRNALLLLVQTWVLKDSLFTPTRASSAVAGILAIRDDAMIPDDIEEACHLYCIWQRNTEPNVIKPNWFAVERNEHGSSYPFIW